MDIDDFMAHGLDSDNSDVEKKSPKKKKTKKGKDNVSKSEVKLGNKKAGKKSDSVVKADASQSDTKKKKRKRGKNKETEIKVAKTEVPSEEESKSEGAAKPKKSSKAKLAAQKHKAVLERQKEEDPEFYEFLQQEGQELLDFNPDDLSDSEEEEGGNEGEDEGDEEEENGIDDSDMDVSSDEEGGIHELPGSLDMATDSESEEEDSEDEGKKKKKKKDAASPKQTVVTMKMVNQWSKDLMDKKSLPAVHEMVIAFKAAIQQTSQTEDTSIKYKVEGSAVFNAIVRVCLTQLHPTWEGIMKIPKPTKEGAKTPLPSTSNKWKRLRLDVKSYIGDLMQLMSDIAEASILNAILKHVHYMVPYYACFPKLVRMLVKKLITCWSTKEESSRVLAFLSINKIVRLQRDQLLEFIIKNMYMAYVRNCKFTSPTTLPLINFMQRSLVEVLAVDTQLTYQYAFIYIRQLAIHLRSAITHKKKDTAQAVYNWQYIHSLHLWTRLLSQLYPSDVLQPLIYPLTQTIIGAIKLVPVAKYYPLRLQCVRALNMLAEHTHTFIPVLPFLIEVLEQTDFNKKHKNISFKPLNFACILKLTKPQLTEKSFKDGMIDQLYEQLMETYHIHAHTIAFPELVLPSLIQLKKFTKQCKVANYTKQIKQIIDQVEKTSAVIVQRRKSAALDITKPHTVEAWEVRSKAEDTPLGKYYATWKKLRMRELQVEASGKERISMGDKLPEIVREKGPKQPKKYKEFKGLFETDSEDSEADDEDDEDRFLLKQERPKKKQKKAESDSDDSEFSDFDEADLEKLAQSASEDENNDDHEDSMEMESDDDEEEAAEEDLEDIDDTGDVVKDFKFSDDDDDSD